MINLVSDNPKKGSEKTCLSGSLIHLMKFDGIYSCMFLDLL